ncbi:hypothetical protein O4J56_25250 [Nocardiopsis sp. RSe5-2]|uniref:DUF3558 domain-containing protein n=1 Tax=Nocardiopsis endophytica TaxID=3018445 RepID=A0ABT4UAI0_9ACTN|nr:hypothetical protein [Nocardiopsis endophytica]MDA2813977.1 hypothetical protein [Nocardiopsis endophytica]
MTTEPASPVRFTAFTSAAAAALLALSACGGGADSEGGAGADGAEEGREQAAAEPSPEPSPTEAGPDLLEMPEDCEEIGFADAVTARADWATGRESGGVLDGHLSCQIFGEGRDDLEIPLPRVASLKVGEEPSAVDEEGGDPSGEAQGDGFYDTEVTERFGGVADHTDSELQEKLEYHLPGVRFSLSILGDTIGREEAEAVLDEIVENAAEAQGLEG